MRDVATTAVFNTATAAAAALAGVVVTRSLGPAARGEYAAILAWFGVVLHIGQLGQSSAMTFFAARHPERAPDYLATARGLLVASGTVITVAGFLVAPLLARGNDTVAWGYRLMFATCLVQLAGVAYTYALQASDIARWNLVRVAQPVLFLVIVGVLHAGGLLALPTALATLSVTMLGQALLAHRFCRRSGLAGGRTRRTLVGPMRRYAVGRLAATVPTEIANGVDQLALSVTVAPAALGCYAVASSLTSLAHPAVSAVGNVAFPRIASRSLPAAGLVRLRQRAIVASAVAGLAALVPLGCLAPYLVPVVFGAGYRDVVPLIWMLAPRGLFVACGQVCGDLLLGQGRPLAVAWAQGTAAVTSVLLIAVLLPPFGVVGAAVASGAGTGAALLIMLGFLVGRPAEGEEAPTDPAGRDGGRG